MRFECGKQNKFECSICLKRFPYKQNARIHLKRKHKIFFETSDEMITAGKIVLLPSTKTNESENSDQTPAQNFSLQGEEDYKSELKNDYEPC